MPPSGSVTKSAVVPGAAAPDERLEPPNPPAAGYERILSMAFPQDSTRALTGGRLSEPAEAGAPTPRALDPERLPEASASVDPLPPADPGRYEILAEHGRGGLGRVYRAHDKQLGRDVALKELLKPSLRAEARFLREALITASLEHPGIVPVHDTGRWPDGTPFYAMKLVAGRPLADLAAARSLNKAPMQVRRWCRRLSIDIGSFR